MTNRKTAMVLLLALLAAASGGVLDRAGAQDAPQTSPHTPSCEIRFEDRRLDEAIRKELGLERDRAITTAPITAAPFTEAAVQKLTRLNLDGLGIRSLEGIQHLKNLEQLSIRDNEIEDLSPLQGLESLYLLDAFNNRITSAEPLASLPNLQWANLRMNHIQSIGVWIFLTDADILLQGNPLETALALHPQTFDRLLGSRDGYAHGPYTVSLYHSHHPELLLIRRGDEVVAAHEEPWFMFVNPGNYPRDLTGDGRTDVAIASFSLGLHCCFNLYIFELGDDVRRHVFEGWHSEPVLKDLDGDGVYEVEMLDWTYAYWRDGSYAASRPPTVVLAFDGDGYRVALEHMRKPPLPEDELQRLIRETRAHEDWETWAGHGDEYVEPHITPPPLKENVLAMLYSGNQDQATEFSTRHGRTMCPEKKPRSASSRRCWTPVRTGRRYARVSTATGRRRARRNRHGNPATGQI